MKKTFFPIGFLVWHLFSFAQVGIGTTSPNVKSLLDLSSHSYGLLIPRMTGAEKIDMALTSEDAGMMVFQTDVPVQLTPKGLYTFDGTNWVAPVLNGTSNGQTLRWDGNKWVATTYLFNSGGSVGLGTMAPNVQFQIHSNSASTTRLQLTSGNNNGLEPDGLLLGITLSNNYAHLIQQENKPLWFGTNGIERMRIDSAGNIGINNNDPEATLDVNGTVKLGANGTTLNSIIRTTAIIDPPSIDTLSEWTVIIPIPNVLEGATVCVNPSVSVTHVMIGYARVSSPGNVEIKFMNMSAEESDLGPVMYNITIIQ